jgi:hypothetical protein
MLHGKPSRLKTVCQHPEGVPPMVMQCDIVAAPQPLVRRYGNDRNASGLEHTECFFHGFAVIIDVFKDIKGHYCIKTRIHKWQLCAACLNDIRMATLAAEVKGHRFDIDAGCRADTA